MGSRISFVTFIGTAVVAVLLLISAVGAVDAIDTHPAAATSVGEAIVSAAASQVGVPYCNGGGGINGPSQAAGCAAAGYSCMSLAQYAVYQVTGITVPIDGEMLPGPNSTDWDGQGTYVASQATVAEDEAVLQPGDVVFFGGGDMWHYAHSGIWVGDGQDEIWDALQTGTPVGTHTLESLTAIYGQYDGAARYSTSLETPTVAAGTPSPDPATFGQSVTYSATVSGFGGTPSGTVAFTAGAQALCGGTLSAGTVTCNSAAAPVGTNETVTATYSGDSTYQGGTATTAVTVDKATPTVAAGTPSPNPATFGQSVLYSATVSGSGGTPSGTVAFAIGGTALCGGTLSAGTLSCSSTAAPIGPDQAVTATYSGDSDYQGGTGATSLTVLAEPGVYVPLTPARICDTRVGNPSHLTGPAAQCSNGTAGKTLAAGGTQTFNVAGDFSVPASNVTAVVLSVATANAKGPGYFTLFPAGQSRPTAANLNYATGQVVPNLVEVGVGAGGAVSLYTSASSDAIVDLEGYVTTTTQSGAGLYNALSTPARICDTRGSNPSGLTAPDTQCNTNLAHGSPDNLIGPNNPLTVNVEGVGGVPATGVAAVVLNVAVVKPAASGYVTVYPTGDPRPNASNVNYTAGTAVGNRVIVPVSPSGQVTLYATASTDIIVDVSGWFTATGGTTGAEFTPEVDPVRICDTRGSNPSGLTPPNTQCNANVTHASPDHPLVAGTSDLIQATGLASVPTGATAAVLNLADVDPTAGSNLTVYPSGIPPTTSDLNPPTGGVASNLVVATLSGSGSFEVANRGSGHTDIIIDVAGWYTTPA